MSYARLGPNSDVYVYRDDAGVVVCDMCRLAYGRTERFDDAAGMVDHLREHQRAGHRVPDSAIATLEAESRR